MASNMYRDRTIDGALARYQQGAWNRRVKVLMKQTPFDEYELQSLCLMFHKFCEIYEWFGATDGTESKLPKILWGKRKRKRSAGMRRSARVSQDRLDAEGFRDCSYRMLNQTQGLALENMFRLLDVDNRRFITMSPWIQSVSTIGSSEISKALLTFKGYDIHGDGKIKRRDMIMYAQVMFEEVGFCEEDAERHANDFVDTYLHNTIAATTGIMTLQEYMELVHRKPLFREFLYEFFPSIEAQDAFLATFSAGKRTLSRC